MARWSRWASKKKNLYSLSVVVKARAADVWPSLLSSRVLQSVTRANVAPVLSLSWLMMCHWELFTPVFPLRFSALSRLSECP